MSWTTVAALAGLALLIRLLADVRVSWFRWLVLAASAVLVYALQPALPIRFLSYALPTLTLALTALSWALVTPPEARRSTENLAAGLLLLAVAALVALARFVALPAWLALPAPPPLPVWAAWLAVAAGLIFLISRAAGTSRGLLWAGILLLVGLFAALKLPAAAEWAAGSLRGLAGQSAALALKTDIAWLGYSYVAFRLIHTLRDRMTGRLPVVSLGDYVRYVIFFPSFIAGPIDRLERFDPDFKSPREPLAVDLEAAGRRIFLGLFKKFVLADTLALLALSPVTAPLIRSTGWMWLALYAFAFQIYFDFAGYTDIAIGLGRLLGVRLPENFDRPYLRTSLGQFWNHWHMTLTYWFRAYVFNPLTRALRRGRRPLPPAAVILITQLATMVLIGLWHGITWSFVAWGAWHGLGLFIHNRWAEWARTSPRLAAVPEARRADLNVLSLLVTFHYVALGWVWFALPDIRLAGQVMLKLFGLG